MLNRFAVVLSAYAAAVLVIVACGSDKNAGPTYAASTQVQCGGKQSLTASGSTAQATR
jgi:phosphate transport system substrate-binding protein